jgi:hypothetical protein
MRVPLGFRSLEDGFGEVFPRGGQNFPLLGGGRQVCAENGEEKERLLRGCAIGFAVYYLGCCSGEGGFAVSGDQGFCKILQGRFKGLDCLESCNKDGHFMELVVYAVGGRRRFLLFPEGRGVQGWNRMIDELCKVMGFPRNHVWVFSHWCVVSGGEEGWE